MWQDVDVPDDAGPPPSVPRADDTAAIALDGLDRGIIKELQDDGRRAFRDIARQVGVSEATVRARVKRLRDARVLQILGYVDPAALGYGVLVMLLIKVAPSFHEQAIEELTSWHETTWVSTTLGRSNVYVQMLCRDSADLYGLLSNRLSDLGGILDIDVIQEVRVHKAEYHYAAPE